ncbi:MAG: hypothetical protein HF308_12575 [Ignavibacteria bacterium]|jgi:hypothetical protein|nr:hypothetical protein [Ignavibacteria bacterium]MCU7522019.1 hypothetical protein [Ignavibacteria bacterium]MCU7525309.1 hypothetical protein [Ignavibacteria bacterium]
MKGYVCLPRDFIQFPVWTEEPRDRVMAFVELLALASYTERIVAQSKGRIHLDKGEIMVPISYLAKRWKRSRNYVYKVLNYFSSRGLIEVRADYCNNIIRIVDWEKYQ